MLKARETPRSLFMDRYTTGLRSEQDSPQTDFSRQFYLVLQYHARTKLVRKIIRDNWGLLNTSYTTKWMHDSKLVMVYRRNPNIKDLLVKSTIPLPSAHGKTGKNTNTCDKSNCIYCASLNKTGKICCKTLNSVFTAKYNVSCQSHNIVYCLTCRTCGLQYVGMTKRKFQERLREDFRNISWADNFIGIITIFQWLDPQLISLVWLILNTVPNIFLINWPWQKMSKAQGHGANINIDPWNV